MADVTAFSRRAARNAGDGSAFSFRLKRAMVSDSPDAEERCFVACGIIICSIVSLPNNNYRFSVL
jgi:hypothetical protein